MNQRKHGFKFSVLDAIILLGGVGLSMWLRSEAFPFWWIVPTVLGHFFLFCNVFLVWQKLELIWAISFVLNVGGHLALDLPEAISALLLQLPVTALIILLQVCSPWYHGIFARRINRRLDDFLAGKL